MAKRKFASEDIDYKKASAYLDHLSNPFLQSFFSIHTGGTFDAQKVKDWKKEIRDSKKFSGLMFWFCLNLDHPLTPQFFLVVEPKFGFDYDYVINQKPNLREWRPENLNELFVPGQRFGENIYKVRDKVKFLKNHKLEKELTDNPIGSELINLYIKNFLVKTELNNWHQAPFSYFSIFGEGPDLNVDLFDHFFRQDEVKYIRYYIGYDTEPNHYPLRVILVPVGEGGKNIDKKNSLTGTSLLQKSWPPPPIL